MGVVITRTANPSGVTAVSNVATYTAAAIGTAASNRIVVVNVTSEVASATINSCTIGGTSMTAGTAGTQGNARTRQFYLVYPTGTTADILVTFGASPTNTQNHISVYTVTDGAFTSTGANNSTDMDATAPLTTGSQTIGTGGGMIAVVCGATDTVAKTWSVAGEDLDADVGSHRHTTWFSTTAATQTLTCTGGTDGEDGAMSWLIFANNTEPTVALNSPVPDPISAATLTSGYDTDGNSTASTSSVSPSANKLLLLTVVSRTGITADPNQPTITGNGLTWVAVDSLLWDTSSSSRKKTTVFRAMGSSPSTGAISIDFGGQNQTHVSWGLEEFTGMDTSGTNGSGAIVQTAKAYDDTTNESSFTVTLGAFSNSNNATFGAWGSADDTQTATAGTGFTKYSDVTVSGAGDPRLTTEFRNDNDTTVTISWSGTVLEKGGIAIEIKSALHTTSTSDLTPTLNFTGTDTDSDAVEYEVQVDTANTFNGNILASDDFNRADENPIGGNWTNNALNEGADNQLRLLSNQLKAATATTSCEAYYNASTFSGYIETYYTIVTKPGNTNRLEIGLFTAMGAGYDGYRAILVEDTGGTDTYEISRFDNETQTVLASGSNEFNTSDVLSLRYDPKTGTLSMLINGSVINSAVDTTYASGSFYPYIGIKDTTAVLDNWGIRKPLIDALSSTDAGFTAGHPFASGVAKDYTVQSDLTDTTTYYWRVRAIDPSGSNNWGAWATTRSFVATAGGTTLRRYSLTTLGVG